MSQTGDTSTGIMEISSNHTTNNELLSNHKFYPTEINTNHLKPGNTKNDYLKYMDDSGNDEFYEEIDLCNINKENNDKSISSTTNDDLVKSNNVSQDTISFQELIYNPGNPGYVGGIENLNETITDCHYSPPEMYGLSYKDICQIYPVKEEDLGDGIKRTRILCHQAYKPAFDSVRKGCYNFSLGSSSIADAIGGGKGHPEHFLMKTIQDLESYDVIGDIVKETNVFCEKGIKYEPLTRQIYQEISGKYCYDGCFMKIHIESRNYPERNEFEFELNNNSSDGIVLNDDVIDIPQFEQDDIIRCSKDPKLLKELSDKMTSLKCVKYGVEFKNPYYGNYDTIPLWYVLQCIYQCMCLNVPYVEYLSTYFSNDTGLLEHIVYARIHSNPQFLSIMRNRLVEFSQALISHNTKLSYGRLTLEEISLIQTEIIYQGHPSGIPSIVSYSLKDLRDCEPKLW